MKNELRSLNQLKYCKLSGVQYDIDREHMKNTKLRAALTWNRSDKKKKKKKKKRTKKDFSFDLQWKDKWRTLAQLLINYRNSFLGFLSSL